MTVAMREHSERSISSKPSFWSAKLMYFEPDIACAFTVTKLKHGFSNPHMFWSTKLTNFELLTEGKPVIVKPR